MPTKKRAATIRDVARQAGVSVSTISRVLNGKDDVAPETRRKVQEVIEALGYTSSLAARGMRSHRTHMIGLIIPDVVTPYCVEVMAGVNRGIAQLDYDLIIYTNGDIWKYSLENYARRYVTLLNGSIVDGVIVVTPMGTDFASYAPLVVIDPNTETPDSPAIFATNRDGALDAMAYLIRLGHRRIGFITGRMDLVSAQRRLLGYKDGLARAGLPLDEELIQIGDYTIATAIRCARALLSLPNRPTAVFASNDMSARGVYQVAEEMGLRIPQDLSVIGFDNLRESASYNPPLTTVDQFIIDMGFTAVEMIVKLIEGQALENHIREFPTRLVIRESCCTPQSVPAYGAADGSK